MKREEPISPAKLLARLSQRIAPHSQSGEIVWDKVSFIDREALFALDAVTAGEDRAEFNLGFWLGFAEGMRAFRGGAYANALSKRSAQRRGKAGGLSLAEKADLRWRNSAKEILPRLQANHPDWGRTRLTAALLESPGFIEMEDQPSEGSVGRLIETMRKKGQLPARKDDSGEEP